MSLPLVRPLGGSRYVIVNNRNKKRIATQTEETEKKLEPILEKLGSLAASGDYSDFVIYAGDSEFKVHKCILAMHSPVFDAMFRNDMEESRTNSLKLNDVSAPVVKEMIDFMYSGKVAKNGHPCSLYAMADKYDIEDLKKITEEIIFNDIRKFDAYVIFCFAHRHGNFRLKARAFTRIERSLEGLVFDEALFEDPDKLRVLIEAKAKFKAVLTSLHVKPASISAMEGKMRKYEAMEEWLTMKGQH